MKFECVKSVLEESVSIVSKIAGKHTSLPVLSCVKVEAHKGVVRIAATNLDMGIVFSVPAKVSSEGVVAVSGSVLSAFLSSSGKEKNVTLEVFQGNLRVIGSKSSTVIKAVPHDDFPEIPKPDSTTSFSLPAQELLSGLSSVSHFSAVSAVKPELASVCVYSDPDWIYFVATDSFRLGEKRIKAKKTPEFKVLIPGKNIPEMMRVLSQAGGDIVVSIHDHQLSVSNDSMFVVSRLVEGSFPDYKQIIPKNHTSSVIALKEDLSQVFKALSVFSDKFNQLHVGVFPKDKRIEFSSKNNDVGESHHAIPATLTGEALEVNFNIRYLIDCLPVIGSDSVSLEFSGVGKPLVIRGVGDSTFLHLVMPMNK